MLIALTLSILILVPQSAAQPDSSNVNPQLASVVATALAKAGPQPPARPKDMTANYTAMVEQRQAATALASEASLEAAQALVATPVVTYTTPTATTSQTEAWYKAWIYNEESGNDPTRYNSSGCLGIGQACPGSKLLLVCPTMDYNCEDNFFTQYMLSRYGSWEAAYNFHIANGWW